MLPVVALSSEDGRRLTRDTLVGSLHERDEVFTTRLQWHQLDVGKVDRTRPPARTAPVDVIGDVSRAANRVAHRQTATNPHAPVVRWRHDDDVVAEARGVERFPLTVGPQQTVCKHVQATYVRWQRGTARICLPPLQQAIDIFYPPAHSSNLVRAHAGLDRRTDTVPFHRPCCAYYAGSANNERTATKKQAQHYTKPWIGITLYILYKLPCRLAPCGLTLTIY